MNWTGGRLSRHSRNTNGSLIQRQKQHFAQARSYLLNGPQKRSPIKWSIFDKIEGAARGGSLNLYTTPRSARHNQPDFGPKDKGRLRKRHRSQTSLKSTLPEATFQGDEKSGFGRESSQGPLANGGSHHGVYQEIWSPSGAEIGREKAPAVETADGVNVVYEADSLEERRRRILRRIDWVGANIQHPIKLRFTVTEEDERLGKRRRVTACHKSQFGAVIQPIITSPFTKPRQKPKEHGSLGTQSSNENSTEALPRNHVRISIGGRHVAAGVASSTSHSKTVGGRFASSRASTSDEMLLDEDDMSRQHRQLSQERLEHLLYHASSHLAPSSAVGNRSTYSASPRNLPVHTPHHKKILPPYNESNGTVDRNASTAFIDLEKGIPEVWTGLNNSAMHIAPQVQERVNDLRGPSDQHFAFVTKSNLNLVTLRGCGIENRPGFANLRHADTNQIQRHRRVSQSSENSGYITNISRQLSTSARKLQPVAQNKLPRNAQIDSQPQLFHPIPLTSRTSRVLSRNSSEADTAVAQIGVEPLATPSQILDEEIWKTWILSSLGDSASESENGRDEVSISPGISNFGHRYVRKDSKQTMGGDTGDMITSPAVSGYDYAADQGMEQSKTESLRDIEKVNNHNELSLNVQESNINHEDVLPTNQVVDYKKLFLSRQRKPASPPMPKPVRVENPDEAWMKFILSDNDDDDEENILGSLAQRRITSPGPIRRLPESSQIVHLSTETASSSQLAIASSDRTKATSKPNNSTRNAPSLSTYGPNMSNHTTQSFNLPSSEELSQCPSSVDRIRAQSVPSFSTPSRPIRKLIFKKPPRFPSPNRGSTPETTAATAGSPVHIGKGLLKRSGAVAQLKGGSDKRRNEERQYERDIYRLKNEDDVESIEDD
jgi:hypothetical protein